MWFDGTFAHKFVFPVLTPPFLVAMMTVVARDAGALWSLIFLPIVILCMWVFFAISIPLKRIRVIGDTLEVTNYRHRVLVPLRLIERVEDVWCGHPWARRIVLSERTIFGDSVVYLPRYRYGLFQRDWPELQDVRTS